jgi:uncharacterized protein YhaN
MSAQFEPDHALQQWREQIEENARLRQTIEDQREVNEKLARLNHQIHFEADRHRSLHDVAAADRDYYSQMASHYRAKLQTICVVANDVAGTIATLGDMAGTAASDRPDMVPSRVAAEATLAPAGGPANVDDAAAAMAAAIAPPLQPETPLPPLDQKLLFLQDTAQATPVPAVTP